MTSSHRSGARTTPISRPLSPHLQVYQPQLTSVMSIMHRITGVFSFLGSLLLLLWLMTLAWELPLFGLLQVLVHSTLGQVLLFLWSLGLVYHLCNGIRHLFWDAGIGFELKQIYKSGYVVLAASLFLTSLIWLTR
ncbi:MAG: succinate dehydrogenase, cytochrome b556 subunit [Arenicellales bacterium]